MYHLCRTYVVPLHVTSVSELKVTFVNLWESCELFLLVLSGSFTRNMLHNLNSAPRRTNPVLESLPTRDKTAILRNTFIFEIFTHSQERNDIPFLFSIIVFWAAQVFERDNPADCPCLISHCSNMALSWSQLAWRRFRQPGLPKIWRCAETSFVRTVSPPERSATQEALFANSAFLTTTSSATNCAIYSSTCNRLQYTSFTMQYGLNESKDPHLHYLVR